MGRGTLTRGPAEVGVPADLAGMRPSGQSAPWRERGTCALGGEGVREASST